MNFIKDKIHILSPVFVLFITLVLTYSRYAVPGISFDGQVYLQIARNIHYGIGLGWQALWFPPLYSILTALTGWLPGIANLLVAAGIVSALMGVVLPLLVYGLANRTFGIRVAVAAGILTAFFPHLRIIQFNSEAEITYTAALMLSLWLTLLAYQKKTVTMAFLAGMAWALAYMGRSEGFLIMCLVFGCCATATMKRAASAFLKPTAVMLVAFLIVSAPYLVFLKQHYGKFTISPKATYVLIWMKSRIYHDNNKGETGNDDLWGLASDGKLKWQQPSGAGDLVSYLMSHPEKSLKVYLGNLFHHIPGQIANNSGMLHYPSVYPPYLALLAVFAAFRRWDNDTGLKKAVLYAPFFILFILPIFTDGWWKYVVPYVPLLIITATAGLFQLATMTGEHTPARFLPWVITIALAGYYLYTVTLKLQPPAANQDSQSNRTVYANENIKAAKLIRARLGPGRNYMLSWNKMIFELDGLWTAEPVADYVSRLRYAVRNKVDFYLIEFSSQDVTKTDLMIPPPGMSLEMIYQSPETDYNVVVYRLNKPFAS